MLSKGPRSLGSKAIAYLLRNGKVRLHGTEIWIVFDGVCGCIVLADLCVKYNSGQRSK